MYVCMYVCIYVCMYVDWRHLRCNMNIVKKHVRAHTHTHACIRIHKHYAHTKKHGKHHSSIISILSCSIYNSSLHTYTHLCSLHISPTLYLQSSCTIYNSSLQTYTHTCVVSIYHPHYTCNRPALYTTLHYKHTHTPV